MIRPLLAAALLSSLLFPQKLSAQSGSTLLRHSNDKQPMDSLADPETDPGGPLQFAPLATGYYFHDNDAPSVGAPWTPAYAFIDTVGTTADGWNRVLSGPNQRPLSDWTQPNSDGWPFFRNPETPTDSSDNAIAGPISIGFPFYFYGRRCDSFYISTNGLVGFSTRRYIYDANGNRAGYDPHSDDPRPHTNDAASDPIPDDDGWRHLAASASGIRSANNVSLPMDTSIAMIAPLWDDCQLTELSKVFYRRDGTRLTIFLENLAMKGVKNVPMTATRRTPIPIAEGSVRVSYQVVLDAADSSVQVNYVRFVGNYTDSLTDRILPAILMFGANSTVGVQGRGGQYTNYLVDGGFGSVKNQALPPPHNTLAVKFKQWRNLGRALKISWLRPNPTDLSTFDQYPTPESEDKFEILLANPLLGVAKPLGIIENVSSDQQGIGGVNYTAQPMRYRVMLRINDNVNSRQPLYQHTLSSRLLYPTEGRYGYANADSNRRNIDTIFFNHYRMEGTDPPNLGRSTVQLVVIPMNGSGDTLTEEWPFDNRTSVKFFGMSRQEIPYITTFGDYDTLLGGKPIPSAKRWVSFGTEVVDGEQATGNPPPPRGKAGKIGLPSVVLRLDRRDEQGNFYQGIDVGDTLVSLPINISTAYTQPYLIFSYQRGGKQSYPRGWSDALRLGPEGAVYNTYKDVFLQKPDALVVEFAEPSPDGVQNIANPTQWRDVQFRDSTGRLTWGETSPRWGVFGGGGGSGSDTNGRIIVDELDVGKDFQFYRTVIPIPTRWHKSSTGNKLFRFRLRLVANDHGNPEGLPDDDDDPFFVDNVMVIEPDHPELEIVSVKAEWPYTQAPASQAGAIPITIRVANNGTTYVSNAGVVVAIQNIDDSPSLGNYSYDRYQNILHILRGESKTIQFPPWNARDFGCDFPPPDSPLAVKTTRYRITAKLWPTGYDSYNANDENYSDFSLTLGPALAYDDGTNDVPNAAKQLGRGLNLSPTPNDFSGQTPFGSATTTNSGAIALRYRLHAADTLYGFQAYFGQASNAPDEISFSISQTSTNVSDPPTNATTKAFLQTKRGLNSITGEYQYGRYVTYLLPTPALLDSGNYFLSLSYPSGNNLELGADASRMGSVITVRDDDGFDHLNNISVPIHQELDEARVWATVQGEWQPMQPNKGNGLYPHLNWRGDVMGFPTNQRGGWMPMLRLWFGSRSSTAGLVSDVQQATSAHSNRLHIAPNPTYGLVQITLPEPTNRNARIEIVDALGNIVRTYMGEALSEGTILWDGSDSSGGIVAAGAYRVRLVEEGLVESVMVVRF